MIVKPEALFELVYSGQDISNLTIDRSPAVDQFNEMCKRFDLNDLLIEEPVEPDVSPEAEHAKRTSTWLVKEEIRTIPVRAFLLDLCKTDQERERVALEMDLYEERDLIPLLQLMMYLVDHFRQNSIVWGVGRGSSVASYCLFLIGVHKIDSLKYGLSIHEFLKP